MTHVSAGVIRRHDGKILLCRRGEGRRNAHLWEFPGGKREAGETAESCLERELLEELRLPVSGCRTLWTEEKQGFAFDFVACETAAEPVLTEHEASAWLTPREMLSLPLCPADRDAAARLALRHPPVRHLLWDFDGTLMDTYPAMLDILLALLRKEGIRADGAEMLAWLKQSVPYAARAAEKRWGIDGNRLLADYLEANDRIDFTAVRLIPGADDILKGFRGTHSLVTHRSLAASLNGLKAHGIAERFSPPVTADDHLPRKPAPDMILHLLEETGWSADSCLMLGDRSVDVDAARAAGVLGCLIDPEHRFDETQADIRLENLGTLAAWLADPIA